MRREDELYHWGIKGMKWGVRRFQNADGSLTPAGRKRYSGDGNAGDEEEKIDYAPKRTSTKDARAYTDEELRAQINRMKMEDEYRTLIGKTDIRVDDPNRELKAEKERLQLQKDVIQLRRDVYEGKSFIKDVMSDSSKKMLTNITANAMNYGVHNFLRKAFNDSEIADIIAPVKGSKGKKDDKKKDDDDD